MRRTLFLTGVLIIIVGMLAFVHTASRTRAAGAIHHYGLFASTSADSGTCGNNWANDTFNRFFTVNENDPNTVLEEFKDGTFVTTEGASPGACQSGTNNGSTVADGIIGKFHGSFDIVVTGGAFNSNATCSPSTCNTTAGFIATVYGPSATYVTGATFFEFHYSTGHNGEWKNASDNRGGNHGDITGTP